MIWGGVRSGGGVLCVCEEEWTEEEYLRGSVSDFNRVNSGFEKTGFERRCIELLHVFGRMLKEFG